MRSSPTPPARRPRRVTRSIVAIGLVIALAAPPAAGRADPTVGTAPEWLRADTRLRLTPVSPSGPRVLVGEFREAHGDSIWIRERYARSVGLPLSGIRRFEVSRERSPRTWTGAGIGFLAGALFGGVAGASEGADQGDTGARVVASGIFIGCLGMILGAIVGHSSRADHWTVVWEREGGSE